MSPDDDGFDVSRAELFEALGHQTRIRLLQALAESPLGFSDLKKRMNIESSGLLAFHLGKLTHLVTLTQDGRYSLADQGKEAVRMVEITKGEGHPQTIKVRNKSLKIHVVIIAILLVALVALGSVSLYQQAQLQNPSNHSTTLTTTYVTNTSITTTYVTTTSITTTSFVPISCSSPVSVSNATEMIQVYQMNPGSAGIICINYQFSRAGNFSLESPLDSPKCLGKVEPNETFPVGPCSSLEITPSISSFDHVAGQNVTVAYLIDAENNATGVYWFGGVCPNIAIPFAVGMLPTSLTNPLPVIPCTSFPYFLTGATVMGVTDMNVTQVPYNPENSSPL